MAISLGEIPTDGTSFMQVETKTSFFASQETECVFTYDKEVMEVLACQPYSRFSVKTSECESLLTRFIATLVCEEEVNGDIVLYYYSPVLENYVLIAGERVNLQVSKDGEVATIGYPMIDIGF